MDLAITDTRTDDRTVLTLIGSLDLASRDELIAAGHDALNGASPAALVIDLAGVNFFDSSGIGALITLANACEDAGTKFSLRSPSTAATRVLDISGLLRVWPVERTT